MVGEIVGAAIGDTDGDDDIGDTDGDDDIGDTDGDMVGEIVDGVGDTVAHLLIPSLQQPASFA